MKRLISILLILILLSSSLFVIVPPIEVHAETLSGQMISFFKNSGAIDDVTKLSKEEVHVYAVFISNFMNLGYDLSDLNSPESPLVDSIIQKFNLTGETDKQTVIALNKIVYDSILSNLQDTNNKLLVSSNGAVLTGESLFKKMGSNNEPGIYLKDKKIMDLNLDTFQVMFKILGSVSIDFMLNYVITVQEFYIDGFGNVWGLFNENLTAGDSSRVSLSPVSNAKLIIPSAINPLSFASSAINPVSLESIKLPLNNAYTMGAFIDTQNMAGTFSERPVPIYNILYSLSNKDFSNVLNIYGITSPSKVFGNAENIVESDVNLDSFFEMPADKLDETKSKLLFVSNMNPLSSKISNILKPSSTLNTDEEANMLRYLYSTTYLDMTKIIDTLYYFGTDSNENWNDTTFSDIGLLGASLFTDSENYFYTSSVKRNGLTSKLYTDYTQGIKDYNSKLTSSSMTAVYTDIEFSLSGLVQYNDTSLTKITTDDGWMGFFKTKEQFIYGITVKDSIFETLLIEAKGGNLDFVASYTPKYNNYYTIANFTIYNLFSSHTINTTSTKAINTTVDFKLGSETKSYTISNELADGTNNWPGIFFAYMVDILSMKEKSTIDEATNTMKLDLMSFESEYLPKTNIAVFGNRLDINKVVDIESGVYNSENKSFEETTKDLVYKLKSILDVNQNDYRNSWIKSFVNGVLIELHRSITGSWNGTMFTVNSGGGGGGTSTYTSITGLMSNPRLDELPFVKGVIDNYMYIYIIMMLLVILFVILMVLLRYRTWNVGIGIVLLMSFVLILPYTLLENSLILSNNVSDAIYSDKFDFWAITQHEQTLNSLTNSEDTASKEYIIANTMSQAASSYSEDMGVRLKWMAPKKDNVFNGLYTRANMSDNFATNLTIFKWLFNSFIYDSEFDMSNPLATYVYRPYMSIVKEGKEYSNLYNKYKEDLLETAVVEVPYKDSDITIESYSYYNDLIEVTANSELGMFLEKPYLHSILPISYYGSTNELGFYYSPERIEDIASVKVHTDSVSKLSLGSSEIHKYIYSKAKSHLETDSSGIVFSGEVLSLDDAKIQAFLKNTESPYYYFYATLANNTRGSFKNTLLDNNFFKLDTKVSPLKGTGVSGNGAVKDFLDLEGLFTVIVPYLMDSNRYVYDWTSINGTNVSSYDMTAMDTVSESVREKQMRELSHKNQMSEIWNMYSPWVDNLTELNVYNNKVKLGTKKVNIRNSLDPSSYLEVGRTMVFSEADMIAKGYTSENLSDIELRMQRVLDKTYEDLMYLVNYYDLKDDVLLGAAAMYATFNFNQEFSDDKLIGDSVTMYPQGFEMKNFNYDAFLRLAILNATGEPIFDKNDLFVRVLNKTSWFTGILIILLDIVSVIIVPVFKLLLLLGLLFLGLLIGMTSVINPPDKLIKSVFNAVLLPMLLFLILNIAFAFLFSLLVGEGLTAYVGSEGVNIATNDPTVTIVLMLFLSLLYSFFMFLILIKIYKSYKQYGMSTILAGMGILGTAMTSGLKNVAGGVLGGAKTVGNTVGSAAVGAASGDGLRGALDGAIHGAKGGGAFGMWQTRAREKRAAEAYANNLASGSDIDNKASKHSSEVIKQEEIAKINSDGEKSVLSSNQNILAGAKSKIASAKSVVSEKLNNLKSTEKLTSSDGTKRDTTVLAKVFDAKNKVTSALSKEQRLIVSNKIIDAKGKMGDKLDEVSSKAKSDIKSGVTNLTNKGKYAYKNVNDTVKALPNNIKENTQKMSDTAKKSVIGYVDKSNNQATELQRARTQSLRTELNKTRESKYVQEKKKEYNRNNIGYKTYNSKKF